MGPQPRPIATSQKYQAVSFRTCALGNGRSCLGRSVFNLLQSSTAAVTVPKQCQQTFQHIVGHCFTALRLSARCLDVCFVRSSVGYIWRQQQRQQQPGGNAALRSDPL